MQAEEAVEAHFPSSAWEIGLACHKVLCFSERKPLRIEAVRGTAFSKGKCCFVKLSSCVCTHCVQRLKQPLPHRTGQRSGPGSRCSDRSELLAWDQAPTRSQATAEGRAGLSFTPGKLGPVTRVYADSSGCRLPTLEIYATQLFVQGYSDIVQKCSL